MFNGADVKDESFDSAVFACLRSAPSSLEASKCADYFCLFPGHLSQTADAEQAYTQAVLGGIETWVRFPKKRWPSHLHRKYCDLVVILRLVLYGHPASGGYWAQTSAISTSNPWV